MLPAVCIGAAAVAAYAWTRKPAARKNSRFPQLDEVAGAALESHDTLVEFIDRLGEYASFDPDAYDDFFKAAADAAEFMERKSEIKHARSVPMLFRGFTTEMVRALKKIRQAIRDSEPYRLEKFDEIRNDVYSFQKEMNKNLWWDAHPI